MDDARKTCAGVQLLPAQAHFDLSFELELGDSGCGAVLHGNVLVIWRAARRQDIDVSFRVNRASENLGGKP